MEWNDMKEMIQQQGMRLLFGLLILIAGILLVHWITGLLEKKLKIKRIEPTLLGFLRNLFKLLMYLIVILTAVSVMGIPLTSVLTIVASAGVAVSLAMQGALSNLVGGLTLLILKPIRVGEYVKVGDYEGTVQAINAFYTEMTTYDNRHISMPNSSLTNTAIVNYTREGSRRLDVSFSVGYQSDMSLVNHTLRELVSRCHGVLPDPLPEVRLIQLGESCMVFSVRVWVKTADYWNVNFYLLEEGKKALDAAGIQIPFPQMDVHIR